MEKFVKSPNNCGLAVLDTLKERSEAKKKIKRAIKEQKKGNEKEAKKMLVRTDESLCDINEEGCERLRSTCQVSARDERDMRTPTWKAHRIVVKGVEGEGIGEKEKRKMLKKLDRFLEELELALISKKMEEV